VVSILFLPRDFSKELTPETLDGALKCAFSSIGAPLRQNALMFCSVLISFSQLRDVGSLSRGSCFGDVCFVFATNVAIDSTRSSSAMSVGDVSLTAAKCTSEKVLRSLLASVFACVAETPGARQLPHHLSWHRSRCSSHCHYQHSSWVWCHALGSDLILTQESQHESTPSKELKTQNHERKLIPQACAMLF